ncbi:MAG: IPT/TIG domain-containing protein [Candidatus Daviesbacteria bacterium]|nr:IPT/TIG domain-containing protein [Candidatus Daviesbacteria bacterium]
MKKIKVFTYLFSLILVVFFIFSAQKASAVWNGSREGAVLLGQVTDENPSLYGSCTNQRKIIGGSCGGPACQGTPTYKVTWSQGSDGDSFSSGCNPDPSGKGSTFVHDEPFYTFERISIPLGTVDGVPTRVSIHVDDPNFKLTKWFHKVTDNLGNECGVPIQQGTFATPSNDQSIEIKAVRKPTSSTDDWGNCRWNHVWFTRQSIASGAPARNPDGTNPAISASVEGPSSGVVGQELSFTSTANTSVLGGLLSTSLLWVRADQDHNNNVPNPDCVASGGSPATIDNVNRQYCNFGVKGFTFNQSTFTTGENRYILTAKWTPRSTGRYYINPFVSTASTEYQAYKLGIGGAPRVWCSGNPFCKWYGASTCPAASLGSPASQCVDCGTISDFSCGGQNVGWKVVDITSSTTSTPPPTVTAAPTDRTYQYRYTVGDACFNAGDASPTWESYAAAGNTDALSINNYQLANPVVGKVYNVCVQFKKPDETTSQVFSRQITYVTPTPPPVPTYTTEYRCSEQSFDKDDTGSSAPQWEPYRNRDGSGAPITFTKEFTYNVVPGGNLTLFCQFKDNKDNKSTVTSKSIKYIGGEPRITSANCTFSPIGTGTLVTVRGINFGLHDDQGTGNIKVEGKQANISSWVSLGKDTSSTSSATLSATPVSSNKDTRYEIKSSLNDRLTGGRHQIVLTTDDGTVINGYCSLDLTTVDFTEKTTCLAQSGDLSATDVAVEIKEKVDGAKSLIKKKINIDKEGKPVDFTPGIEIGKTYVLSLKAPKTVSRKVEFIAEEGTTNLGDIILYVGDIYPVAAPDNKVNAFDKGEMSREWALNSDVSRTADLNTDSRVNSVDYSCLQNNYNKGGE